MVTSAKTLFPFITAVDMDSGEGRGALFKAVQGVCILVEEVENREANKINAGGGKDLGD